MKDIFPLTKNEIAFVSISFILFGSLAYLQIDHVSGTVSILEGIVGLLNIMVKL